MDLRTKRGFGPGRVLMIVVALVAVALVLKLFNLFPGWPHAETHTSIEPSRLQAQLVAQQQLQVYDLTLQNVVINQSNAPEGSLGTFWHTDTVLHAYGDVEVTVDWKMAKVSGTAPNGSVTVSLPEPQIAAARLDHSRTFTERPRCGINVILGCRPNVDLMYRAAEAAMRQEAENPKYDLMHQSRLQAEVFVRDIVEAGRGDPAKVKFVWRPNPA